MKALDSVARFFLRFRYPASMPEDIAASLGITISNSITFDELVRALTCCCPTRLMRFMPREQAEEVFCNALRKECFQTTTLISYYFNEGWMEFSLQFDNQSRLRRLYIQHKYLQDNYEIKIPQITE